VRGDPFTGVSRFHNGIDLAGDVGTPVMAAMSGRVSMVGYNPNYGRYVILSHAEGFQTLYGHLDSFQVRRAARVKQGSSSAPWATRGTARAATCTSPFSSAASLLTPPGTCIKLVAAMLPHRWRSIIRRARRPESGRLLAAAYLAAALGRRS